MQTFSTVFRVVTASVFIFRDRLPFCAAHKPSRACGLETVPRGGVWETRSQGGPCLTLGKQQVGALGPVHGPLAQGVGGRAALCEVGASGLGGSSWSLRAHGARKTGRCPRCPGSRLTLRITPVAALEPAALPIGRPGVGDRV